MKRLRMFVTCCMAAVCLAAMVMCLAGCGTQEEYKPPMKSPTVSSPTIGEDGVLRVGVNTENQPLAGISSSSDEIVGIDVDIAAAIANYMGLKLEVVDVGTDVEGAISDGTVDIVMGVDKSESEGSFWTSEAYLPSAIAIFATVDNNKVPTNSPDVSIAAQVSSKSAWAITNDFDEVTLSTASDLQSAFASLEAGEVEYVASDAVIGTYAAFTADYEVHIVDVIDQSEGYGIAVSDSNDDLKQAISEVLATLMDDGTIKLLEIQWLGTSLDPNNLISTEGEETTSGDEGEGAASEDDGESDASTEEGASSNDTEDAAANAVTEVE